MSTTIPLVKDILDVYPDTNINDHIDAKMIEMYKNFVEDKNSNVEYTDDEIYNYVKFINMSCLSVDSYKHVVPYITEDNINFFSDLFNNYDILYELFPMLPYKVVVNTIYFNDVKHKQIKDKWICNNMTWIKRYKTELLNPYLIFEKYSKYYLVNGTIYSDHCKIDKRVTPSYITILDMEHAASKGRLQVVKYIIDIFYEIIRDRVFTISINSAGDFISTYNKAICAACENNNKDIVIYMVNYMKTMDKLHLLDIYAHLTIHPVVQWMKSSICNIEIFNYLANNDDLKPNNNVNKGIINGGLLKASKMNNIQAIDFLLKKGANINYVDHVHHEYTNGDIKEPTDVLTVASYYGNYEAVVHLIEKGIDVLKYCHRSISHALNNNNLNINSSNNVKIAIYIIDKFANISKSIADEEKFFCTVLKCNNLETYVHLTTKYYSITAFECGNIQVVKDMINNDNIRSRSTILNLKYMDAYKLIPIIRYNLERLCIEFMNFMMKIFKIMYTSKFISESILEGYLELAAMIYDLDKTIEISIVDVENSIMYSKNDRQCIEFIERIYKNNEIDFECIFAIAKKSCNKGYLDLIKHIFNNMFKGRETNTHIQELLKISIYHEEIEIVKYIMNTRPNIDMLKTEKMWSDNLEINKLLIEKGADINGFFKHFLSYTGPLELIFYFRVVTYIYDEGLALLEDEITCEIFYRTCRIYEFVEYFLNKGFKMGERINSVLEETVFYDDIYLVKLLVKNKEDVKYIDPDSKILVKVCKNNDLDTLKVLIKYFNLNVHNGEELLYACINENLEMVVFLIENGADFQINDNKLLRISAKYGYVDIVKYLVETGADVNIIDKKYYHKDVDEYLKSLNIHIQFLSTNDEDLYSSDDISESDVEGDLYD